MYYKTVLLYRISVGITHCEHKLRLRKIQSDTIVRRQKIQQLSALNSRNSHFRPPRRCNGERKLHLTTIVHHYCRYYTLKGMIPLGLNYSSHLDLTRLLLLHLLFLAPEGIGIFLHSLFFHRQEAF